MTIYSMNVWYPFKDVSLSQASKALSQRLYPHPLIFFSLQNGYTTTRPTETFSNRLLRFSDEAIYYIKTLIFFFG